MKCATFQLTTTLLAEALRLPVGTRITAAGMNEHGNVVLEVTGDSLPENVPGGIRVVLPMFEKVDRQISDTAFVSWGTERIR